jgi:hypothetical protein
MNHDGKRPSKKDIKSYGHGISILLEKANEIAIKQNLNLSYERPKDALSQSIVSCLDSFANAREGRYANFDALGDPNFETGFEPISKWWKEVARINS